MVIKYGYNKSGHDTEQLMEDDLFIFYILHKIKALYLKVKPGCSTCKQIFIGFFAKTRSTNMSIVELPPKAKSTWLSTNDVSTLQKPFTKRAPLKKKYSKWKKQWPAKNENIIKETHY